MRQQRQRCTASSTSKTTRQHGGNQLQAAQRGVEVEPTAWFSIPQWRIPSRASSKPNKPESIRTTRTGCLATRNARSGLGLRWSRSCTRIRWSLWCVALTETAVAGWSVARFVRVRTRTTIRARCKERRATKPRMPSGTSSCRGGISFSSATAALAFACAPNGRSRSSGCTMWAPARNPCRRPGKASARARGLELSRSTRVLARSFHGSSTGRKDLTCRGSGKRLSKYSARLRATQAGSTTGSRGCSVS